MRNRNQSTNDTTFERWVVIVGILLLAFNLRPAAVSVGPVLAEVKQGLGMGNVAIGMLTSLPVVAFAALSRMIWVSSASFFHFSGLSEKPAKYLKKAGV